MSPQLKLLPPSKPRLGLYLRPGRNDHTVFQQLLAEDKAVSGLVLDARHLDRQRELRASLIDNGVHAVLDVDFMEMATPGGSILAGLADLQPCCRSARLASPQSCSPTSVGWRHGTSPSTRSCAPVRARFRSLPSVSAPA